MHVEYITSPIWSYHVNWYGFCTILYFFNGIIVDFDLSKQSENPSAPTVIRISSSDDTPTIDTKSCTSDLRTNSFVGTEEYIAPEGFLFPLYGNRIFAASY